MKENELRYGSIATIKGIKGHQEITSLGFLGIHTRQTMLLYNYDKVEPILLSEESFLMLGAIKDESGHLYIAKNKESDMRFYLQEGYIQLTKGECCPFMNYKHITTVHAFQNLYYALNGYELISKYHI